MWRLRGFRASQLTPTRWKEEKGDEKWRRRKESPWSDKKAIWKRGGTVYPEISCWKENDLVTINVRGFCTAFLRKNATGDRLIVPPDYDYLRKSTGSLLPFTGN